jgi:hypothetical protein
MLDESCAPLSQEIVISNDQPRCVLCAVSSLVVKVRWGCQIPYVDPGIYRIHYEITLYVLVSHQCDRRGLLLCHNILVPSGLLTGDPSTTALWTVTRRQFQAFKSWGGFPDKTLVKSRRRYWFLGWLSCLVDADRMLVNKFGWLRLRQQRRSCCWNNSADTTGTSLQLLTNKTGIRGWSIGIKLTQCPDVEF